MVAGVLTTSLEYKACYFTEVNNQKQLSGGVLTNKKASMTKSFFSKFAGYGAAMLLLKRDAGLSVFLPAYFAKFLRILNS